MTIERPAEVCKEIMSGISVKQSNKMVALVLAIVLPVVMGAAGWLGSLYGGLNAGVSANSLKINTLETQYKSFKEDNAEIKEAQKRYAKNQDEMMRALRELLKQSKIPTDILSDYDANIDGGSDLFPFFSKMFKFKYFVCSDP